jgi:hypothetical protein
MHCRKVTAGGGHPLRSASPGLKCAGPLEHFSAKQASGLDPYLIRGTTASPQDKLRSFRGAAMGRRLFLIGLKGRQSP